MDWDDAAIAKELEKLAAGTDEIADVFGERLAEITIPWRDGDAGDPRVRREDGVAARRRARGEERFAFVSGWGDAAARAAVRALDEGGSSGRPPGSGPAAAAAPDEALSGDAARWVRRLPALLARHAPRHRLRLRLLRTERRVVATGRPASESVRRLVSVEGVVVSASRLGDEERPFAFHAPDGGAVADELKAALVRAAAPRDRPIPATAGETDAVLASGCAAVLFHEILAHALEADAGRSPISSATEARLTTPELDVRDDPRRLDLFGGYERDDEGTAPRSVKLIHSGRIGARITDRATAAAGSRGGSTGHGRRASPSEPPQPRTANVVVAAGSVPSEELVRRLGNGLWIDEIHAGSAEPSSGSFRLAFHRARRVHRGRLAEEIGPGSLFGEMVPALRRIEPALGREAHPCRSLGWCARDGRVLPVQGEAPDLIVRALAVRPAR